MPAMQNNDTTTPSHHSRSQTSDSFEEFGDGIQLSDSALVEIDHITNQSYARINESWEKTSFESKSFTIQPQILSSSHMADQQNPAIKTAQATPLRTPTTTSPSTVYSTLSCSCKWAGSTQPRTRSESRNAPFNSDKLPSSHICPKHSSVVHGSHNILSARSSTDTHSFTLPKVAVSTVATRSLSSPSNVVTTHALIPKKFYAVRARQLLLFTAR
jgi:hypothetical protein